ncbi:oxidoreductase, zinc-binding dehydrogenase family protein [Cooperia oncophora]
MAVVPAIWAGSHAEYVVSQEACCSRKPSNLNFSEAAAMPYVANTAWAALVSVARMNPRSKPSERVLIHGGSGGVGTIAIQMLKAWGTDKVVVTCSKDSADLVRKLGGIPVDYRADDVRDRLIEEGPYEVVFDCADTDLARWSDKIVPVVERVQPFSELPAAYERVSTLHNHGKTVLTWVGIVLCGGNLSVHGGVL